MCFRKGLPKPKILYDISVNEVKAVLKTEIPDAMILYSDSVYQTTTVDELQRFLDDDKTNEYRYVSEYYDCDDFSFRLMGQIHNVDWGALPFGIVWTKTPGGNHAANCFIDNKRELWFIEPQNDSLFRLSLDWKPQIIMI